MAFLQMHKLQRPNCPHNPGATPKKCRSA